MRHLNYKYPLLAGDFSGDSIEKVREWIASEFDISRDEVDKYQIYAGALDGSSYDSSVWLLLRGRETGEFFEVRASHCSCYGYEGMFTPEKTTRAYLQSPQFGFPAGLSHLKSQIAEFLKTI